MLTQSSPGTMLQVLVFRTDLRLKRDHQFIASILNRVPGILRWNVDQHDIDNVLRIETECLREQEVIGLVTGAGYHCSALPD